MSTSINIKDDGDEKVLISINEDPIAVIDHDTFGWAGMEIVIKLVEEIADNFGIEVYNTQDIV
jgi:hypothetical protein